MFPWGKDEDETNGFGRSPCLGNEQGSTRKYRKRLALIGSRTTNRGGVRVVWETVMAAEAMTVDYRGKPVARTIDYRGEPNQNDYELNLW